MSKFRVCLCGPRCTNSITGVGLAFDLLVMGMTNQSIDLKVVDSTLGLKVTKAGTFSPKRACETIVVICLVWFHLFRCQVYYSTMSTSFMGFIRDYLTIGFAKTIGCRTVLHLHGGGFEEFYLNARPWLQSLIRSNLKRTDSVVVLGERLKKQFYCTGNSIDRKLIVVPNGLTLGVDEPVPSIKRLPENGPIQLLYLSSLMPSKGFLDVLQAISTVNKLYPDRFHLNLCGNFVNAATEKDVPIRDETELLAYIRFLGITNCVTYHGQVVGQDKIFQFINAHIFLLPTLYVWEGQPLSIIEALAFSTPVLSCHHKGIPEQVKNGINGVLLQERTPQAIVTGLLFMTQCAKQFSAMSTAARKHYELNFRREVHLSKLVSVILKNDSL